MRGVGVWFGREENREGIERKTERKTERERKAEGEESRATEMNAERELDGVFRCMLRFSLHLPLFPSLPPSVFPLLSLSLSLSLSRSPPPPSLSLQFPLLCRAGREASAGQAARVCSYPCKERPGFCKISCKMRPAVKSHVKSTLLSFFSLSFLFSSSSSSSSSCSLSPSSSLLLSPSSSLFSLLLPLPSYFIHLASSHTHRPSSPSLRFLSLSLLLSSSLSLSFFSFPSFSEPEGKNPPGKLRGCVRFCVKML
jgi:hypothetical protein